MICKKLANMVNFIDKQMNILKFSLIAGKLKSLRRTGWIQSGIKDPESVADHSYRLALLAMVLAPSLKLDQLKVIKMSLIHDLGEAEIGDIVTRSGRKILDNLPDKIRRERIAIKKILSLVDKGEYLSLFDEYEEDKTKEAKFVKQLDKLEMAIQAYEYEKKQKVDLGMFFIHTNEVVKDPELRKILKQVEKLRK
jgi:putative hydrolases of HD superfamily